MKTFSASLAIPLLSLVALPALADDLKDCAGCKDRSW